ncbi:MAG: hypothetical protein ACRDCW_07335, partial [Sarcina sp.]
SGSHRYDLGFGNPNTTAIRMFIIAMCAMYIYKKEKYNKYLFFLATVIFPAVILYITYTRTAIITYIITYLAFYAYDKRFVRPLRKFKQLLILLPVFLLGLSTVIAVYFGHSKFLNKVLSRRPSIWHDFFYKFHCMPTLLGRNDDIVTVLRHKNFSLDCSYISLICIDGLIITAIVIGAITLCLYLMLKEKMMVDVIFICGFLIYGFSENIVIDPRSNVSIILVGGYLMYRLSKRFRITNKLKIERLN